MEKPKSFFAESFAVAPGFGESQQAHFSFSLGFLVMHEEHSQDEAFCFSTIDLNTLSAAIGAVNDGIVATAAADVVAVVVSVLTVEGKTVGFPNEN